MIATHIINDKNYDDAIAALKDILYLFLDAVVQDGDFSELESGSFDPFLYLSPEIRSDCVLLTNGELDLLRKGAAIALLSRLSDVYFEDMCSSGGTNGAMAMFNRGDVLNEHDKKRYDFLPRIKQAFENNHIIDDPCIHKAFLAAFSNEEQFYESMLDILEEVVKPCFITLGQYRS